MSHPLFDDNAPKQQTQIVLPAARNGSSPTPYSYRQARRYGQNNRFEAAVTRAPDTQTLYCGYLTVIEVDDVLDFDASINNSPAATISYTSVSTDVDTELAAFAAAIQANAQYLAASYSSVTKRLTVQAASSNALTKAKAKINGGTFTVD